jgi:hypothetical protein
MAHGPDRDRPMSALMLTLNMGFDLTHEGKSICRVAVF